MFFCTATALLPQVNGEAKEEKYTFCVNSRIGESFEEACRREVFEETGLTCGKLEFLTDFSGKDTHHIYPNGDECYIAGIIYICFDYSGEMKPQEEEVIEQRFFALDDLPEDIEVRQLPVIEKVRQYLKDMGRL